MKPIKLYKIINAIWLILFILPLQGCIEDDLTVCGVNVRFTYTKNVDRINKFSEQISKVDLFVFDSEGKFITSYTEEGERLLSDNYVMNLNLMPDTYDFVVWGNLYEDYEITPFERGVTKKDEVMLSLIRSGNIIDEHPGSLFFGGLKTEVEAGFQTNQSITIDMMKDTKAINVKAWGLPLHSSKAENTGTSECMITSRNGDYKFDNSITGDDRLQYIPKSYIHENDTLISDFITLRELEDNTTASRLIVEHNSLSGQKEVLFNEGLVELLLPATIKGELELDIIDEFNIELEFEATYGSVTVRVNGWEVKKMDIGLGW